MLSQRAQPGSDNGDYVAARGSPRRCTPLIPVTLGAGKRSCTPRRCRVIWARFGSDPSRRNFQILGVTPLETLARTECGRCRIPLGTYQFLKKRHAGRHFSSVGATRSPTSVWCRAKCALGQWPSGVSAMDDDADETGCRRYECAGSRLAHTAARSPSRAAPDDR